MNLLDILLVVIVGASVVTGFMAGFARVGIGFIAAICGVLFGFWFYGIPAEWIHQLRSNLKRFRICSDFLWSFSVYPAPGALIGKLLSKLFKWTGLILAGSADGRRIRIGARRR